MTDDHPVTDPDIAVDDQQIERNKLAVERGWLVAPSPTPTTAAEKVMDRYLKRTPDERAALAEAGEKALRPPRHPEARLDRLPAPLRGQGLTLPRRIRS